MKFDIVKNEDGEITDIQIKIMPLEEGELGRGEQIGNKLADGRVIVSVKYPTHFGKLDLDGKKLAKEAFESNEKAVRRKEGLKGGGSNPETSANAKELRKALELAGDSSNPGDHAHHIVASTHSRAKDARDILEEYDIGINSASNGVFVDEVYHSTLHTHAKIDSINFKCRK